MNILLTVFCQEDTSKLTYSPSELPQCCISEQMLGARVLYQPSQICCFHPYELELEFPQCQRILEDAPALEIVMIKGYQLPMTVVVSYSRPWLDIFGYHGRFELVLPSPADIPKANQIYFKK